MAGDGATTSIRTIYRRRLAAAAVASVVLHLILARGLALTPLGLEGAAAEAAAAPKPARKPAKDFAIHAPKATAARPAHEQPLTIAATPRASGAAPAERPTTRTATERRPEEAAEQPATAPAAAPAREKDLAMADAAAPARSNPVTAPAPAATALADDAATTPATADAASAPATRSRDHDGPAAVASRWRPREVALLERLIAPAPTQPESARDTDADSGRPTAANAGDRPPGRRPISTSGQASAMAIDAPPGDAGATQSTASPAVGPPARRRRTDAPAIGGGTRGAPPSDVADVGSPGAVSGTQPSRGSGSPSRGSRGDEDSPPGRRGSAVASGPGRAAVAAGTGPAGSTPLAANVAGPASAGTSADVPYGPRAVGRASGADAGQRLVAALPGIGRGLAGAGTDDGEELSVPRTAGTAGGPRRDDDDDEGATRAMPRPPERITVVPLPPESRVRDVAEAFARRGRDSRDTRRSNQRVRRADEIVDRGLQFLARAQQADGRWTLGRFAGSVPADAPELTSDTAATGLALLAFLGAGHDHFDGPHRDTVRRGLEFLLAVQKPDGDLFLPADELSNSCAWLYSHGIASIALCEAVGMTGDPLVRPAAAKACGFIAASQHPERGGWRYVPRSDSDLSVSGWMLVALRSGALSGVETDPRALAGVRTLLEAAASADDPARYAYNPRKPDQRASESSGLCMTAVGALMRLHTGAKPDDPRVLAAARALAARRPAFDERNRDSYLWYYASQVLVHTGGAEWDDWYATLVETLAATQETAGGRAGSWDPLGPRPDRWGRWGGRLYVTALHLLALEVPDRRLPTYTAGE